MGLHGDGVLGMTLGWLGGSCGYLERHSFEDAYGREVGSARLSSLVILYSSYLVVYLRLYRG